MASSNETIDEFDDDELMEKEGDFTFSPPEVQGVKMKDDEQHRLWHVYKFGGEWDLGDGNRVYPPGDPRIKGKILSSMMGIMHKATRKAKGASKTPAGAINEFHFDRMSSAIDSYDPVKFSFTPKDAKDEKRAPQLSSHVYGNLMPKQMGGGAVGQRVVAREGGAKAVSEPRYGMLARARPIMEQYQREKGHPIPPSILAARLGESVVQVKKMLKEGAPEYDPNQTVDDMGTSFDRSLNQKDVIYAIYTDQPEPKKRMMEWFYPTILTPKIPVTPDARKQNGEMYGTWMSKKLNIPQYTISRYKTDIENEIKTKLGHI